MPSHSQVIKNNKKMLIMEILPLPTPKVEKKAHQVNSHQKINPKNYHLKLSLCNNKKTIILRNINKLGK